LQVRHPVLTLFTDFLILDSLATGADRWANTLLRLKKVEEFSSPDEADNDFGCIILHDGLKMAAETARRI
jgi:hypothetical protein